MIKTFDFKNRDNATRISVEAKHDNAEPVWISARVGDAFKANGRIYLTVSKWNERDGDRKLALIDIATLEEAEIRPDLMSITRITLDIKISEI